MNNQEQAGEIQNHKTGWKKRAAFMALFLAAVIGGFICLLMPPGEPAYQGKPLSWWLSRSLAPGGVIYDLKDPKVIECRDAIRHIGTNAIPNLLRILRAKDSRFKLAVVDLVERQHYIHVPFSNAEEQKGEAQIGFYLLGDLASNAIPALVEIYTHPASEYSKEIADSTLMQLYPLPGAASPSWVPPQQRAQWYFVAGMTKLRSDATSNAILAFSESIKLGPTNADSYLMRGAARIQLQDFTGAIMDVEKVMELSPSNEEAFNYRGLCKFNLKDFKSADADFTASIHLETNNPEAFNYRGLARANLRKFDDALADFNKAIELSSGDATAYRNRAMVEGVQKEYELALADVSKSIELDNHDATSYASRGRIQSALKDYKAALADFDKSIELNPKDSLVYSSRAIASMYLHDFKSAAAELEKALQINPKNPAAFLVRGVMKAKRGGEDEAALADLRHAVELAPQEPETYGMLGLVQYKISDLVPALANCRKALELGVRANVADFVSYIWLIRAQSGEEAAANTELNAYLKSMDGAKTNEWSAIPARFFTGSLSESNFLILATTSAKRPSAVKSQVCESLYYAGMKRKLAGDKPGAMALFEKCLNTKDDINIAYINAVLELRALKQP